MTKAASDTSAHLVAAFSAWRQGRRVLSVLDVQEFVRSLRRERSQGPWGSVDKITQSLSDAGVLKEIVIPSDGPYRPFQRFVTPDTTVFDVATKLRPQGYLSHATAVYAHGLTDQVPHTVYVNNEQSSKPAPKGELSQAALDRAFRSRQRVSKFAFVYERQRIVILNGKQTGRCGVSSAEIDEGEYMVTDLERTLIDIAVRPVYGGGIYEIIAAYKAAATHIDPDRIVEYLRVLDYRYPYHQAIGFYLEQGGAPAGVTEPLRRLGLRFDFPLLYGMKASTIDPLWRVQVPQGLELSGLGNDET